MKTRTALVTSLFALASSPLWAQQPSAANQQDSPAAQQSPSSTAPAPPNSSSASAAGAQMSPVNGELLHKLDSKTAKNGDSVVVQTKTTVKTPDGTEIPKGSKLVGHVLAVQPSQPGQNSHVALQFDHVELKGGKTMPIHSQIQSISPAEGAASASGSSAIGPPPAAGSPSTSGAANGGASASGGAQGPGGSPGAASVANPGPPPGTLVAQTGQIAIRTTSIPGVLVANNAPGEQDPRMADASSIVLGARRDIELDGGTLIVVGVAPTGAGTQ